MKKVFIHAGLHKTATSSIQQTMHANSEILANNGILYPKFNEKPFINHSYPIYSAFCSFPEKYHLNKELNSLELEEKNKANLNCFGGEVRQQDWNKIIISGEDISVFTLPEMIKFKEFLETQFSENVVFKIIIYVRNPRDWTVSNVQEFVRHGYYTIDQILKEGYLQNVKIKLNNFQQVFGKESIVINEFESAIKTELGIIGHFLSLCDFSKDEISGFTFENSNESSSRESIMLLNLIVFYDKEKKINFSQSLIDNFTLDGEKFDLPFSILNGALNESLEDVDWLKNNQNIVFDIKDKSDLNSPLSKEKFSRLVDKLHILISVVKDHYDISLDISDASRDLATQYENINVNISSQLMAYAQKNIQKDSVVREKISIYKKLKKYFMPNKGKF